MILDETTKGLPRCWHEILVISVGYQHSLCPRRLVFFPCVRRLSISKWHVAYGESEYSFLCKCISRGVKTHLAMTNHRHQNQLYIHETISLFRATITCNRKQTIIRVAVVESVYYLLMEKYSNQPVSIVHTYRLLSVQHACSMRHHTRFVQGGLSVENEHVSISQMSKYLLIDSRCSCGEPPLVSATTVLGCK